MQELLNFYATLVDIFTILIILPMDLELQYLLFVSEKIQVEVRDIVCCGFVYIIHIGS